MLQISHREPTQRRVFGKGLAAHFFLWLHHNQARVPVLQEFWILFSGDSGSPVNFGSDLLELAGNVGGMAIYNRGVTSLDSTRVINDDDLCHKFFCNFRRIFLGISCNITSLYVASLELNIKSNVVTRLSTLHLFMMHFNRFNLAFVVSRGEPNIHLPLQNSGFNSSDSDSSKPSNFVHIINRNSQGFLHWPLGDFLLINCFSDSWSFVPRHVLRFIDQILACPA